MRTASLPCSFFFSVVLTCCSQQADTPQCDARTSQCEAETPNGCQLWEPYLSTSSWPSIHHDPYNSDFNHVETMAFDEPGSGVLSWYRLGSPLDDNGQPTGAGGAITLLGQSIDDVRGLVFVPTGKPGLPGLHALYTRTENAHSAGDIAWTSKDFKNGNGEELGTCSVSSTPLLGNDGSVYIGDCRYLWAFDAEGGLKWIAPLPKNVEGQSPPLVSAIFTRKACLPGGRSVAGVGGVTARGELVLFDTEDGVPLVQPYLLPNVVPTQAPDDGGDDDPIMACMWRDIEGNPMLDEDLIEKYMQAYAGVGMAVANTPLVMQDPFDERTTRIYVPAVLDSTSETPDGPRNDVKLFRVDVTYTDDGQATAAQPAHWSAPLPDGSLPGLIPGGNGTATTPTLSADGRNVFVGDSHGILRAFDADSGEERWELRVGTMWGSITATWPETDAIYVVAENAIKEYILKDRTITLDTRPDATQDFKALAETLVPEQRGFERVGMAAGLAAATPGRIYTSAILGYRIVDRVEVAIWPMRSVFVVLDRDLNILNTFDLPDGSETAAIPDRDGNIYVTYASTLTSVVHCLWRKGLLDKVLPEPLRPSGGITVFSAKLSE